MNSLEQSRELFKPYGTTCLLIYDEWGPKITKGALCYASVFKTPNTLNKGSRMFLGFGKSVLESGHLKNYVDYLVNRSAFKDCYLTKDLDEGMSLGFEVDLNREVEFLRAGCIALRRTFEINHRGRMFNKLTEDFGFSEDDAHVFILQTKVWNDPKEVLYYFIFDTNFEHEPILPGYEYNTYLGRFYSPYEKKKTVFDLGHMDNTSWGAWTLGAKKVILGECQIFSKLSPPIYNTESRPLLLDDVNLVLNKLKGA